MDRREEILRKEIPANYIWEESKHLDNTPFEYVFNAMDEHAKEMCLLFSKFIAHETTGHSFNKTKDELEFKYKGEWISKEKLFENFL
jgi:hypothetical protein